LDLTAAPVRAVAAPRQQHMEGTTRNSNQLSTTIFNLLKQSSAKSRLGNDDPHQSFRS